LLCIESHHLHGRGEKKKVHIDTSLLSFEGFNNRHVKAQLLEDLLNKFISLVDYGGSEWYDPKKDSQMQTCVEGLLRTFLQEALVVKGVFNLKHA
jgi:hypothetical protein